MVRVCYLPLVFVLLLIGASGCREQQSPIRSYEAPKETLVSELPPLKRMLGAILPAKSEWWFLKVTGDPREIEDLKDDFSSFASSMQVTGKEPKWTLPAGWEAQAAPEQMRSMGLVSQIRIPVGEKHLTMTVSKLASGEGADRDEFLLANLNRWRRQLGLFEIEEDDLPEHLEKVDRKGQTPIYVCELQGVLEERGMGAPPFASLPADANSSPSAGSARDSGAELDVRTQPPPEWQPGQLNSMRKAAFVVSDGDQRAETTVTFLTAAGGELLPNVQRWRGQIGLPPIAENDLAKETKTLDVDGKPAAYFVMHGPEEKSSQPQSLLVVIVPRGELVWFIKMMGDSQLVRREQERFEQFARTIQFQ